MLTFRPIQPQELRKLSELRRVIHLSTYGGIYPDDMLDNYPYERYMSVDKKRLEDPDSHYLFLCDGKTEIGYVCFQEKRPPQYKDFYLYLGSLYLLPAYQGCGHGREVWNHILDFCKSRGYTKFYNQCNPHNKNAIGFYKHMGGVIGFEDLGHSEKIQDSVWFEHFVP